MEPPEEPGPRPSPTGPELAIPELAAPELAAKGPRRARGPRALLLAVALAWVGIDALASFEALWPVALDEPLALRWLRMLPAHPVRAKVGLASILWGLLPHRGPTTPR